ncbi:MAG TPA: nucleotidyltransferase substrate binding protein [bacterium]|nr:nucleotidyltransferase substrate binding protein [bacterium]
MALVFSNFKRALTSLEKALALSKDDIVRDSVVKRFEYSYELAWKLLQRALEEDLGSAAVDGLPRRELFRIGAEKRFIADVAPWFEYHRLRNLSSHTYNEEIAEEMYKAAVRFALDARLLLKNLEARNG